MSDQPKLLGLEDGAATAVTDRPLTLYALLDRRLAYPMSKLSKETVTHYRRCLRQYGEHLGHVPTVADLTPELLANWLQAQAEDDSLSNVTANARAKQIKALWRWGHLQELVPAAPVSRFVLPEDRPIPDSWSDDELDRLFSAAAGTTGYIGPHWASDYWQALLWVAYNTGERSGSLLQLTPQMVDLKRGTLEIPASIRKGENVSMRWWLTPRCVAALGVVVPNSRKTVFGDAWRHNSSCCSHYNKLLKLAGIAEGRRQGLHKMRRTVASWIKLRGGDPGIWLGHAPKSVAEASYIDRWLIQTQRRDIWPLDCFDSADGVPELEKASHNADRKRRRFIRRRAR